MFKWVSQWLSPKHYGADTTFDCKVPMPKVKPTKGNNISEPVLGIIRAFNENPKRFKFDMNRHPMPDWFGLEKYLNTTGNYFRVLDKETGEEFHCSVTGLARFSPNASRTFFSRCSIICILGYSLIHGKSVKGYVHNEWLTKEESDLLVETIGNFQADRIMKVYNYREWKEGKEERAAAIKKALKLVEERQRLCEIYK